MVVARPHHKKPQGPRPRLPAWLLAALLALLFLGVNWCVQALRKPSEVAGLVIPATAKSPAATWAAYGELFEENATEVMTPELLAAIAQTESEGNPVARTYWKWRWSLNPFRWFAPASSAVGLFQVTDGTFGRCRDLCIHDGRVAHRGPWYDPGACWFNGLYNRLIPAHSIEMMSACLDWQTEKLWEEGGRRRLTLAQKQDLAAASHLCGPRSRTADRLKRGLPIPPGERCGDHDPRKYLARVRALRTAFSRLRARGS